MNKIIISFLTACFIVISSISAIGFSIHSTTISRSFDKELAVAGETIMVTVSFTNLEVDDLRGFYYTEYIPDGLSVSTINVNIGATEVANYVVEMDQVGGVYTGYIPFRWIMETPSGFSQSNPISQNSDLELVYSVKSSQAGTFNLNEFSWVGYYSTASQGQRAAFGHSEDVDKQTITFTANPDLPVASFTGSPTSGTAPLSVSFLDTSTGEISSWSWDFGDSGTSTQQNPTYTYDTPGTYTVTLDVVGPGGNDTLVRTNYIMVTSQPQPPVANFTGSPTSGTAPLSVSFTDTSTGEISSWSWDFGDGGTSTQQNPTHTYIDPGTYTVTLEVTGPVGSNTQTHATYVTVTDIQLPYTLTVNLVGEGSLTLDPAGVTYDAGTEVQLTPISNVGWAFHGWSGDLSGYSNPKAIVMDSNKTITATFDVDSDDDGISDAEETACPNGGDGNSDGIRDSEQLNVASLHSQDGAYYVTMESSPGTTLAECRAVAPPDASGHPPGVTFPYDFFNFTINGVGPGGDATVIFYLSGWTDPTTYWKYGATPVDANPHWYEFMYETATQTGAEIDGNIITLHFVDGKRGDDIQMQDGMIIDQGGPGVSVSDSNGTSVSGGGGGGGGCFISIAADGMDSILKKYWR